MPASHAIFAQLNTLSILTCGFHVAALSQSLGTRQIDAFSDSPGIVARDLLKLCGMYNLTTLITNHLKKLTKTAT